MKSQYGDTGETKNTTVFCTCAVNEAPLYIELLANLLIVRLFQEASDDLYSPVGLLM